MIRNTRLRGKNETVDIAINDGKISQIDSKITKTAEKTIETSGGLPSPGFVDCHKHPAKAYASRTESNPMGTTDRLISGIFMRYIGTMPQTLQSEN